MFELETKKYKFDDFPDKELTVWGRKNTLDFALLDGVKEYDFPSIPYNDGDTIIDIGAYTGQEMLWFVAKGINLTYFAFEPLGENFNILEKNIKENNKYLDIDWAQFAIGDYVGRTKIYFGGKGEGKWKDLYKYMGNIKAPFRSDKYEEVTQITLEKIFEAGNIKHCKLLKIDCEGAELKILRATPKKILDRIRYIIGEYHEPNTLKQITKATKGLFKNTSESDHLFRFVHK
jgi:FkbM family methyltransferase